MCFHWKSLLRQIRISGTISLVADNVADVYYNSRSYESRIGAWASQQSEKLNSRDELINSIAKFKKNIMMKRKFQDHLIGLDGIYHLQVLNFG